MSDDLNLTPPTGTIQFVGHQPTATFLRWPRITAETLAVAVVLLVIGLCLWPTRFSGLGDNLIAVAIVVFVVGGMEQLRKFLVVRPRGYRVLRMMGLKQEEVQ